MTATAVAAKRIVVLEPRGRLAELVLGRLAAVPGVEAARASADDVEALAGEPPDAVIYSPLQSRGRDFLPELGQADRVLGACARLGVGQVVLVSSAAVYGADYHNPGLIRESRVASARRPNRVADAWRELEARAERVLGGSGQSLLTVLRPVFTPVAGASDWASRLFHRRWAILVAGHNPSIQVLDPAALADAIGRAIERCAAGTYNVAPDAVAPLRLALRSFGVRGVPLPWTAQRVGRTLLGWAGLASSSDQQEYLRYSWTVCNERSRSELGMDEVAAAQSVATGSRDLNRTRMGSEAAATDAFGMDEHFIHVRSGRLLSFLARRYWRIEMQGLEHVPIRGPGVLAGVHRGFMPFDGVMMVHLLAKHRRRIPRFLMHPGLVKFPFLADFLTKLGGIIACHENADRVLGDDELLGIFPEGIRGAFRMYREAYSLGSFGRHDFVRMALRQRAPIIPFVIVGTAEMFPILGKVEWSWWKRKTEWPFFPITPTFPLLPVPLPTKWHLQVLPPIPVSELYPPEAASDARVVRHLGDEVRSRMQEALDSMRRRRRSVFFGPVFDVGAAEPWTSPALGASPAQASRTLETSAS